MKIVARSRAHPLQSGVGVQARPLPAPDIIDSADESFQSDTGVIASVIGALSSGLDEMPSDVLRRLRDARNAALAKRRQ